MLHQELLLLLLLLLEHLRRQPLATKRRLNLLTHQVHMHLLLLLLLMLEVQLLLVWNRRHGFGALRTDPAIAHLVLYLFGLERARADSVEVSRRVERL